MKKTLLKGVERFRLVAMLLVTLCCYATASAQLSSDEISEAILVEGSVPVKWTNDAEHPWYIPEGEAYIRTPEVEGSQITALECSYTSSYPTEISFSWSGWYNYSPTDYLTIEVDGVEKARTSPYEWTAGPACMAPAGQHTVKFIWTSDNNIGYWAGVDNVRVWECKELESACLKDGSLPLTFKNDSDRMWIAEDGYIRSQDMSTEEESTSTISTTFTLAQPSVFSLECRNLMNNGYYADTKVIID